MSKALVVHYVKLVGAFAAATALNGCMIYPARGPRYGYYYHPRSYDYY